MPHKLIAGNWKMNGLLSDLNEIVAIAAAADDAKAEAIICPPATLIDRAASIARGSKLRIGGQDCHASPSGAHTGDVSANMLADLGATCVILGHSERRANHDETSALVAAKAAAAYRAGLTAIVCVGETDDERTGGMTLAVVESQLSASVPDSACAANTVIAYEPVWAIGTGRVPTEAEIAEVHAALRGALIKRFGAEGSEIRLLYGGSVKPSNAASLFAIALVDGALIGGASLKASDFAAILRAVP
ncbi:triose-phosphate isomerase [Rhizobium sp. CNPSo 3464]|uniref:triose-phosphate isomerase n=1 Tax=Rhizobium sp. CNPSo 3464 TaxID=3021406 RepID=UPI00254A58DC|nr:triose-phosphate isomerase [Rhizobium sp. CNPSo 3464]MDK4741467.1 triose-phosphate isomerase [Rhizobium sp. CNPSo 3464]